MFTGLIESVGTIRTIEKRGDYLVYRIESDMASDNIVMGESIACDGACLTVISLDKKSFVVEASAETASCTIIENYKTGSKINLERALKTGARLGGHFVSGHIDTTAKIQEIKAVGNSIGITVQFDPDYDKFVIEKGSIAINGISLTINEISKGTLSVNIIPHTAVNTTVEKFKQGQNVNLEFDMLGKYIYRMINKNEKDTLTIDKLLESGW